MERDGEKMEKGWRGMERDKEGWRGKERDREGGREIERDIKKKKRVGRDGEGERGVLLRCLVMVSFFLCCLVIVCVVES